MSALRFVRVPVKGDVRAFELSGVDADGMWSTERLIVVERPATRVVGDPGKYGQHEVWLSDHWCRELIELRGAGATRGEALRAAGISKWPPVRCEGGALDACPCKYGAVEAVTIEDRGEYDLCAGHARVARQHYAAVSIDTHWWISGVAS